MTEQAFTGMGIGMALEGAWVTVEIMFGDFITLTADQMINHAAKFHDMYGEEMHFVVRTPVGAYRGYGATHSQSLESIFMGIPGMQVVATSILYEPGKLLTYAMGTGVPTLFVENKTDYGKQLLIDNDDFWNRVQLSEGFPIIRLGMSDRKPDFSIVTYGGMVSIAMEAAKQLLYEEEIETEIIIPSLVSDTMHINDYISADKVIVLEEGVSEFGWGAEIGYNALSSGRGCKRIGARKSYIPAGKVAEAMVLPCVEDIAECMIEGFR